MLADLAGFTRLRASGPDLLGLLHRLSTQDLEGLAVGSGAPTVLTSAKGRIVERLFVHRAGEHDVWLCAGPGSADRVLAHLKKYTFAERTGLSDATASTAQLAVLGDTFPGLPDPGPWGVVSASFAGIDVVVLGQDGFTSQGRSIVCDVADRPALDAFGPTIDGDELESWRVRLGYPASGRELTEDWNPLEAGLRDHVSFTKGCYVGQEVVARLNTYDKVSRRLVTFEREAGAPLPAAGTDVLHRGTRVGTVTSAARCADSGRAVVMAYVKWRDLPEGAVLSVA
jgi:folate-binding protein YgfZ